MARMRAHVRGAGGAITHRLRFVRTPKFEANSAAGRPVRAVQVGGPLGSYLPAAMLDLPMDYEAFAPLAQVMLSYDPGGSVQGFDDARSGLRVTPVESAELPAQLDLDHDSRHGHASITSRTRPFGSGTRNWNSKFGESASGEASMARTRSRSSGQTAVGSSSGSPSRASTATR